MGKINDQTIKTPAGTDRLLGADQDTTPTGGTANYTIDSVGVYLLGDRTAVPGSTAPGFGTTGQYAVNATHFFICVATNSWKKVALSAI